MHPRNGRLVRPLLACRRAELRAFLAERGLPFVDDETNADVSIPRNRVRAELLPLLAARFNPSIVDVLADQAELARDLWTWIETQAAELSMRAVHGVDEDEGATRTVDLGVLAAAPVAVQRAVLWRAMREVAGRRSIDFKHVEEVRRLVDAGAPERAVDAPGQRVERIAGTLVLRGRRARVGRPGAAPPNLFRYPLSIPGEVFVPAAAAAVSVVRAAPGAIVSNGSDGNVAFVRGDLCVESLAVRNRRPGDRFHPAGLNGRKKLQDYFVDRKVPRERRDAVPIVVDATDKIVWVAGHQIDDAFRVTDRSQSVLILTFKAVGGAA
jgi:tRNA(Ile)-lysidine synthase